MNTFQAKPIIRVPLNQHVVDAIIDAVRNNELQLGDKLPSEGQLCEQFGVGRHVIREALRRLQEMSIVRTETGKGTFICSTAPESLGPQISSLLLLGNVNDQNLFDFRLAIESYASYFAAGRITDEQCQCLKQCLDRMNDAKASPETSDSFLQSNYDFHHTVVEFSGNQMYVVLYNTMNELINQIVKSAPYSTESTHSSYEEHKGIYQALVNHDQELAFQLSREHLMRLRRVRYDSDGTAT